jgi:para-aminobenzoate synthetase component 1
MNNLGEKQKPFLFIINYRADGNFVWEPHEINPNEVLFKLHDFSNIHAEKKTELALPVVFKKHPPPYPVYERSFQQVKKHLEQGNSYLVNLTFPTDIETNLKLEDYFHHADVPYKLLLKNKFVVFSPETFIRISGNRISSFPMKGTIDASIPDAENMILNDPKEKAEHVTIVDLIRNDLSMISDNVRVDSFRQLSKITTRKKDLLQVSSEISGEIPDDFFKTLGTSFFKLLPAGSICGAPKKKTLEIIKAAEIYERGFYTGVFGYFDGKSLESAVMIRFLEQNNTSYCFKSGGGITVLSNCKKEYQELIDKVYVPFA